MQSISTVEADTWQGHPIASKFGCIVITELSTNNLVNVSLAKLNVEKEFCPDGHNGLPYYCRLSIGQAVLSCVILKPFMANKSHHDY